MTSEGDIEDGEIFDEESVDDQIFKNKINNDEESESVTNLKLTDSENLNSPNFQILDRKTTRDNNFFGTDNNFRKRKSDLLNQQLSDKKKRFQSDLNNKIVENEDEMILVNSGFLHTDMPPPAIQERKEPLLETPNCLPLKNVEDEENMFFNNSRFRDRPDRPPLRGGPMNKFNREKRQTVWENSEEKRTCIFHLQGKCTKGTDCEFVHVQNIPSIFEPCRFHIQDRCHKRNVCLYMHDEFPCKFHHTKKGCFAGKQCKFSHLEMDKFLHDIFYKYLNKIESRKERRKRGVMGILPACNNNNRIMDRPPPSRNMESSIFRKPRNPKIPSLFDIKIPVPGGESSRDKRLSGYPIQQSDNADYEGYMYENGNQNEEGGGRSNDLENESLNPIEQGSNTPVDSPNGFDNSDEEEQHQQQHRTKKSGKEHKRKSKSKTKSEHHHKRRKKESDDENNRKKKSKKKSKHVRSNSEEKRHLEKELRRLNKKEHHHKHHRETRKNNLDDDNLNSPENPSSKMEILENSADVLAHLPKMQQDLYLRIQQQQKEADATYVEQQQKDFKDQENDLYNVNYSYSSDDESSSTASSNIMTMLKNSSHFSSSSHQKNNSSPTYTTAAAPANSTETPDLSMSELANIHISEDISKLLSTIRMQTKIDQSSKNVETSSEIVPTSWNPVKIENSVSPKKECKNWGDIPISLEVDEIGSGDVNEFDDDDIDVNNLPFKPVPIHETANEIEASLTSHPPFEYKLIEISNIVKTNYISMAASLGNKINLMDPRFKAFRPSKSNRPLIDGSTPDTTKDLGIAKTATDVPKIPTDPRLDNVTKSEVKPADKMILNQLFPVSPSNSHGPLHAFPDPKISVENASPISPLVRKLEVRDPRLNTCRPGTNLNDSRTGVTAVHTNPITLSMFSVPPPNILPPNFNIGILPPTLNVTATPMITADSIDHNNITLGPSDSLVTVLPLRPTDPRIRKR